MDDLYWKLQAVLMRKDLVYGELKFLTSRTTEESKNTIEDICRDVENVFQATGIPIREKNVKTNSKCVQAFKYLMLNTNFKVQEQLAEDLTNGHLVDMHPPLSPYLFLQILWNIEYEEILTESILHIPVDLCIEILIIIIQCVQELEFERATDIVYTLIINVYKKLVQLKDIGSQSLNFERALNYLIVNFEVLLDLLSAENIFRWPGLSVIKQSERHGIIFKYIIQVTKNCLEYGMHSTALPADSEKLYKLTFGRMPLVKYEKTVAEQILHRAKQGLLNLLLKNVKQINCNVYLGWAELNDKENTAISLQRSIANDCYYFIEFMKSRNEVAENKHLIKCLQQLSSKPDSKGSGSILSLQELCHKIKKGKKQYMKQLMVRYREWDHSMLNFVDEHKSLLDRVDCMHLLEYVTFVLVKSEDEDFKKTAYNIITRILYLQSIPDMYQIVTEYITTHDSSNSLEFSHTEETFNDFIVKNTDMKNPKNLKVVLLFLLKNPNKVLSTLIKMMIGYPGYSNIMISGTDLLLLSPIMRIKEKNNETFLVNILKTVCAEENIEWNRRKFADLVTVTVEYHVLNYDDWVNKVFVPYLESSAFNVPNMSFILNNIRQLQDECTAGINMKSLLKSLARRMSFVRKRTDLSKSLSSELLLQMIKICEYFFQSPTFCNASARKSVMKEIKVYIEPIDRSYLTNRFADTLEIFVTEILQEYESCFVVINRVKEYPKTPERLREYLSNVSLLREDFLRHLILHSIQKEYCECGLQLTLIDWSLFNFNNVSHAYDDFMRITMEACCISLEYPTVVQSGSFAALIQSITFFNRKFLEANERQNIKEYHELLIENVGSLAESVKRSPYSFLFTATMRRINVNADLPQLTPEQKMQELLAILDHFAVQCRGLDNEIEDVGCDLGPTAKISSFHRTHQLISACFKVSTAEAYECISRMSDLLFSV